MTVEPDNVQSDDRINYIHLFDIISHILMNDTMAYDKCLNWIKSICGFNTIDLILGDG